MPAARMPPAAYARALNEGSADKRVEILRGVARTGSISQAARDSGVSYKAAWQAIDTLTNLAGVVLVERAVGGAGGGGARITPAGLQLLSAADALSTARAEVLARLRDAPPRSRQPAPAALGQLSIRTSMRNQLPCRVGELEVRGATVLLRLELAERAALLARVTRESAELLALRPGEPVVAMCKATAVGVRRAGPDGHDADAAAATRAVPAAGIASATLNRLAGIASRVKAGGAEGDEVVARLDAGPALVGFAPPRSGLRAGSRVLLVVDAAALVIAVPG